MKPLDKPRLKANPTTKLAALKLTKALWLWLYEHPKTAKYLWPGWDEYAEAFVFDCPCCDYVASQQTKLKDYESKMEAFRCVPGQCPLAGFAWKRAARGCVDRTSPFTAYADASDDEKYDASKAASLKIVAACDKAMKAMSKMRKTDAKLLKGPNP